MGAMRILYLIPGPMSQGALGPQELQRRQSILQKYAADGTHVSVRDTKEGPASIESAYEEYLSIPNALQEVQKAEGNGIDAMVMGCFGDPGLDAARELVKIPVVGPAEASMHVAAMLGHRFSVITVLENVAPLIRKIALLSGLESRLASVRCVNTPVLSLAHSRTDTIKQLVSAGRRAVEDGADSLILGCMSMAFLQLNEELQRELELPVVNPALTALKIAESLVAVNLSHSKKAFMAPPKEAALKES